MKPIEQLLRHREDVGFHRCVCYHQWPCDAALAGELLDPQGSQVRRWAEAISKTYNRNIDDFAARELLKNFWASFDEA